MSAFTEKKLADTLDSFPLVVLSDLNGQEFRYIFVPSLPAVIYGIYITANSPDGADDFDITVSAKDQEGNERWLFDDNAADGIYASGFQQLLFGPNEYICITTNGMDTDDGYPGGRITLLGELKRRMM